MGTQAARCGSITLAAAWLGSALFLGGCNNAAAPPGQAGRPADVQSEMQRRLGPATGPGQTVPAAPQTPGGAIRPPVR
jgi:hypothetical protein